MKLVITHLPNDNDLIRFIEVFGLGAGVNHLALVAYGIAHVEREVISILGCIVHHIFLLVDVANDVQLAAIILRVFERAISACRTVSADNYRYRDSNNYNTKN